VALAGAIGFAMMLLPLPDVVQALLAVAAYTAMIILLRALPREVLELVPPRVGRLLRP
jgi:hypothetical protein